MGRLSEIYVQQGRQSAPNRGKYHQEQDISPEPICGEKDQKEWKDQ